MIMLAPSDLARPFLGLWGERPRYTRPRNPRGRRSKPENLS